MSVKLKSIAAGVISAAVLVGVVAPLPAVAETAAPRQRTVVAADLQMSGSGQQRWQSVPRSRIVLNPFDRYAGGTTTSTSEVDQNSGANLPVRAAYYSNDKANAFPELLSTYATAGVDQAPALTPLARPLIPTNGWSASNVTATQAAADRTAVSVNAGSTYGRITTTTTVDLDETRYLTVDVDALSAGAVWAAEINGKKLLPNDSTLVGPSTYDLVALLGASGVQSVEIRLWVAGGSGKTATFDTVTLHSADLNPATDSLVLWRDEFASADGWSSGSGNATLASNGAQGIVKIDGGGGAWGSTKKDFTVDVTPTTRLAVNIPAMSHKWALNAWVDGREVKLQEDSNATGWVVLDDFAAKVGSGTKTVSVRLFTTGARPSAVAVDDMLVYDPAISSPWREIGMQKASETSTSWTPSVETFTASYGAAGTISGRDVFASTDTVVREVDATSLTGADPLVAGAIAGAATWDADLHQLTVTSADYVQVYAFPADAEVGFGSTLASAVHPEPHASARYWTATLPRGGVSRIAIAFAPVSSSAVFGTDLTVAAGLTSARTAAIAGLSAEVSARVAELDAYWNEYLEGVPVPSDFSLHGLDAYGITGEQTAAAYYRAFVNLQQNVIPATPETNSLSAQLGTGKASMWMSGIPGAKNVATWDTLVGLQSLVYADPETAWESFTGIMQFVQGEDSDFPGEITNDPAKGGEVLPSRKAQTAWILYNATGDRNRLESLYPALKRVLNFGATNLHWTVKDRGIYNDKQRDSEFVTSLILDLAYAKKISALLGKDDDIARWTQIEDHLYSTFDSWFVRQDGIFQQKVDLASDDDEAPVTTGAGANGDTSVVAGSLALAHLSDRARAAIVSRFDSRWRGGTAQFAGLGDNLKGPNMNYIVDGLLDNDHVPDGAAKAALLTDTIVRDVARSGWFAEVYKSAGNGTSDRPVVDGVRPSLFGIAAFIDSVWSNNGFRISEGGATFVRLGADRRGGVAGLTYRGRAFDLTLGDDGAELSGPAVGPESIVTIPLVVGETTALPVEHVTPAAARMTMTRLNVTEAGSQQAARAPLVADVSVTASDVSGAAARIEGAVTLVDESDASAILGTAALDAGQAQMPIPADLAAGEHRLRAVFASANEAWWESSQSGTVIVTIPDESTPSPFPTDPTPSPSPTRSEDPATIGGDDAGTSDALAGSGGQVPTIILLAAAVLLGGGAAISILGSRRRGVRRS